MEISENEYQNLFSIIGNGPWSDECSHKQFEHSALRCVMLRSPYLGHWCGYVGVPPSHPLFGKDHSDVSVDVHGGLTYSDCDHPLIEAIIGSSDLWWFGFDCAHGGDLVPLHRSLIKDMGKFPDHYWTQEEVMAETKHLAEQL